jgi:hypothetical protein
VYSHDDLKKRCEELGSKDYLIEGIIPSQSLGLLVGDSGLGKSPLVYQMALCISSGKPFLGHGVKQGPVLVLDFENGLGDVGSMLDALCLHIGLSSTPKELHLWNINDCGSKYGQPGNTAIDMILDIKPSFVILDSLTGLYPKIEKKSDEVTTSYQQLRKAMKEVGASVLGLHHIRKPPNDPQYASPSLDGDNYKAWFLQTRGARAIINGCDVRLGVDSTTKTGIDSSLDAKEIALVLRGFGRVRSEIPLQYLTRAIDEEGQPLGYQIVTGARLLGSSDQQETFGKLPERFRFKDAQKLYGKGAQPTTNFLNKCIGLGLIHKRSKKGGYEKLEIVE